MAFPDPTEISGGGRTRMMCDLMAQDDVGV